jgi:ATP-dependent Clp protease ATP-binding subunit ClpA
MDYTMPEELRIGTRQRLDEIDRELSDLRTEHARIKSRWEIEKSKIQKLQALTSEIEDCKLQAQDAERSGDYGKVAELRYGRMLDLNKQIEIVKTELVEIQAGSPLLKEEIDHEDVAEVVAKWTGCHSCLERHTTLACGPSGRKASDRIVHLSRLHRGWQDRNGSCPGRIPV